MNKNLAPRAYAPRGLESRKRVQLVLSGAEVAQLQAIAAAEQRTTGAMARVVLLDGLSLRNQRDASGEQPHATAVEAQ